jgi:serine/threonine-protein kinase
VLDVGAIVAGKFRIERIIGAGGMGVVAVAMHLQLDQRVALKVLHDRTATDPSAVERFLREARAVAKLKSEHVCRVFDVGQLADGAPYIVMELLEGHDLAQLLAERSLAPAAAIELVLQACVAIAEAHAHGIVHRDLKPANLFVGHRLDGSPLVKVLDFGIAKAPNAADAALTHTNAVLGTPAYMAPEQLRSTRDVDARADIWALGIIIYQAISGRLPFPGASLTEIAVKIAIEPPDPIDVAPPIAAAIARCLDKEREGRYRDVGELARAFAPFSGPAAHTSAALATRLLGGDGTAPTAAATPMYAPVPTTLQSAASAMGAPAAPRHTARWLGLGGVALAVAAIVIAGIASSGGDASAPPAPLAPLAPSAPPASPSGDEAGFADAIASHHCQRAMTMMASVGATEAHRDAFRACQKGQQIAFQHANEPDSESYATGMADDLIAAGDTAGALTELEAFYYARGVWACMHADPDMARRAFAKLSAGSKYRDALIKTCGAYKITLE